jgi:hypothetical protein
MDETKYVFLLSLRKIVKTIDNLRGEMVFRRPAHLVAVSFPVPIQLHEPLKLFVYSVEEVVVHTHQRYVFIR